VDRAGDQAAIVVTAPFEQGDIVSDGSRIRPSRTAEIAGDSAQRAQSQLVPGLAATLRPPLIAVRSGRLDISGHGPGRTIQLAYLSGGGGGQVDWIEGGPPEASVPANKIRNATRAPGQVWPVQVGLSAETAAQLDVRSGDRVAGVDAGKLAIDLRVTGIYRPRDRADPVWLGAPELLTPVIGSDGTGTRIELAALMTADSLPDGRLALDEGQVSATVTFLPEPSHLRWENAQALATEVLKLKASSGSLSSSDTALRWESRLDLVLAGARTQIAAAVAQASVLLIALILTATLVLLLAADLLVRRRATVLASVRMRGASLPGIGGELLIESAAVVLTGAAVGLLAGRVLAGGFTGTWLLPVVLVALLGVPVLGTLEAARATRGRQAPANRSARRSAVRTGQLRRVTLEFTIVLATAAAFTALHQRGVLPTGADQSNGNVLPALAPTLGAATGALVLLRLLPLAARLALARATRSRGSLPLFAAARAAANAARPLPFVILIMSTSLLTFALAVSTTESDGQAEGSWRTVGADARLNTTPSAALAGIAARTATADGVDQAVAAHVADTVMLRYGRTTLTARLVVVDPAAFARLLGSTPLPATGLSRLDTGTAAGQPVPALLRAVDGPPTGTAMTLLWDDEQIDVTPIGTSPAIGDDDHENLMIVNAATFAAAGAEALPNTVWVTGPRAGTALAATAGPDTARITRRADVLQSRRSAPLAAGLQRLALVSIGILLLWALLAVVLGAAASAPSRGETLARLRTLGLRPAQARRVATGELLPPVALGALSGLGLGVLLAHATLGRLALRLITGQRADPALVVPWTSGIPVLLLVLAVGAVVAIESSVRRRERLGEILRAGGA
jgi:putative ABC transport system permease protein